MKLIPNTANLNGMDCHLHSRFSPDARACGADEPQKIADAVREKGLRGFIITDHLDVGHWDGYIIDFDKYFEAWERVRKDNPDLTIYIGLEVGFEPRYAEKTDKLISGLPFEYVINSIHYWKHPEEAGVHEKEYTAYLNAVLASLDAPYPFSTVGHLGFLERYLSREKPKHNMRYDMYRDLLDGIMDKALKKCVRFEENTNAGGEMRLPRADFLKAYKAKGGIKPVLGSDAHQSKSIGQYFPESESFLNDIFD